MIVVVVGCVRSLLTILVWFYCWVCAGDFVDRTWIRGVYSLFLHSEITQNLGYARVPVTQLCQQRAGRIQILVWVVLHFLAILFCRALARSVQ